MGGGREGKGECMAVHGGLWKAVGRWEMGEKEGDVARRGVGQERHLPGFVTLITS